MRRDVRPPAPEWVTSAEPGWSTSGERRRLSDLRERFDEVLATLEAVAGWSTERVQRPVLILGQLAGILTGVRQLRRTRPLEVEEIGGLRVPTLAEMVRIKAWLLAEVVERLAAAAPNDATEVDLQRYRALQAPWTEWTHIASRGRHWAQVIGRVVLEA